MIRGTCVVLRFGVLLSEPIVLLFSSRATVSGESMLLRRIQCALLRYGRHTVRAVRWVLRSKRKNVTSSCVWVGGVGELSPLVTATAARLAGRAASSLAFEAALSTLAGAITAVVVITVNPPRRVAGASHMRELTHVSVVVDAAAYTAFERLRVQRRVARDGCAEACGAEEIAHSVPGSLVLRRYRAVDIGKRLVDPSPVACDSFGYNAADQLVRELAGGHVEVPCLVDLALEDGDDQPSVQRAGEPVAQDRREVASRGAESLGADVGDHEGGEERVNREEEEGGASVHADALSFKGSFDFRIRDDLYHVANQGVVPPSTRGLRVRLEYAGLAAEDALDVVALGCSSLRFSGVAGSLACSGYEVFGEGPRTPSRGHRGVDVLVLPLRLVALDVFPAAVRGRRCDGRHVFQVIEERLRRLWGVVRHSFRVRSVRSMRWLCVGVRGAIGVRRERRCEVRWREQRRRERRWCKRRWCERRRRGRLRCEGRWCERLRCEGWRREGVSGVRVLCGVGGELGIIGEERGG